MNHNLFKPQSFEDGQHGVVGDCNGIPMAVRYKEETPLFAKKILGAIDGPRILDYGCGVGRIAKEILKQDPCRLVVGVDESQEMMAFALMDVQSPQFTAVPPQIIDKEIGGAEYFDGAYLVYVLQHVPAIEIREVLQRIHYHLKKDGILVYCSSDYRMAIRFDGKGFHDDRYLGVNLFEELTRYFDLERPLFTDEDLEKNKVLKKMITGIPDGLAHPALVLRKKEISGPLFNALKGGERCTAKEKPLPLTREKISSPKAANELILIQKQSPGDIMMATVALRDLHTAYPGKYKTDMRTPCNEIFYNNPYVAPIQPRADENEIIEKLKADDNHPPLVIDGRIYCNLHYPMIHQSGQRGTHFADSMTDFLAKQLDIEIPRVGLRPEIYLDQNEQLWPSPVMVKRGFDKPYWVLNAGIKSDFPLKQYPFYSQVVDMLEDKVNFVQIGLKAHMHPLLAPGRTNVIDMIGGTENLRELFRLIFHAEGVITCVSVPMHIAAALKKPCVVVAGGREGTRWELYPDHRFLYTNGALDCCLYDGCWKSRIEECVHTVEYDFGNKKVPLCMDMIKPQTIVDSIMMYYKGGILKKEVLT